MSQPTQFDYIIVGAGSAGCMLANELGADPNKRILLLEAGPPDRQLLIHIPAGVYSTWRDPALNWSYQTDAESELLQRQIDMPRGKVLGGSSSINSMVYMRGHPLDYDRWALEHGLKDWHYANCLPYFKACEQYAEGGNDWRGDQGRLGVCRGSFDNPLYDAFIESGELAGQGRSDDLNGYNPEGVARFDATKRQGRRCSSAVAHLKPALARGNVTLLTHAQALGIQFDGNTAIGVDYRCRGQQRTALAAQEVLLCGGAIHSPQLLMTSGVGDPDHLREHNIDVRVPLPAVGQHLQDHASAIVEYESLVQFPVHRVDQPLRKAAAGIQWVFTRDGIAASNIWEAGGLIRSNDNVPYPNIQYHFGPVGVEYSGNKIALSQAFSIHVDQLRPLSEGCIMLAGPTMDTPPTIKGNYLNHPNDREELAEGVLKVRELVAQQAFDGLRGREITPGPDISTRTDIIEWLRSAAATDYHPCGTCRMGTGEDSVVDSEFRVRGCQQLRVIDASVIPQIPSANLNAPVQMIASRAADIITGKPPLPPLFLSYAFDSTHRQHTQ